MPHRHAFALLLPLLLLPACTSPPPPAFTGAPPILKSGLELTLQSLSASQETSLKDGATKNTLLLSASLRAEDRGVNFSAVPRIRFESLRDERGSDLLAHATIPTRAGDDTPALLPFQSPNTSRDTVNGHRCHLTGHLNLPRIPERFSIIEGTVEAVTITRATVREIPLPLPDGPERFQLKELTPGLWFSLDVFNPQTSGLDIRYRWWLCNDLPPEHAGKPELESPAAFRNFAARPEMSITGPYKGHDERRPPFIQSIDIISASEKRLASLPNYGGTTITRPTGIYGEFSGQYTSRIQTSRWKEPAHTVRVTIITEIKPVIIDFALKDVPLSPPPAASHGSN